MAHVQLELARDRHQGMQAAAAQHREGSRALARGRVVRQAERAERRTLSHADEADRLRARIAEMEAAGG
jgi:hypothetical protein